MFTDRFIQIPVKIFSTKTADLTGVENHEDTYRKINPMEISSYGPTDDDDNGNFEFTSIRFKNGDSFCAYIPVEEFEKLLNDYNK